MLCQRDRTLFYSIITDHCAELLIYGTGYRLLWWRLPPLTLLRRDWMIGMTWNHKLLLTSTTTTSNLQVTSYDCNLYGMSSVYILICRELRFVIGIILDYTSAFTVMVMY